ncbi:restriction endonuclease [bacterium]|nr:restriction endonuclease [bacterium]
MNHWTNLSIEYANQRNYLDDLFKIYPTIPDGIREINEQCWKDIERNFNNQNNVELIKSLLQCDLFPIKDSYVAYLKRDKAAIERNPQTINRLAGRLYEMGLDKIYERCSEPKETNRQIGPLFKRWICSGALGIQPVTLKEFISNNENAILNATDTEMAMWCKEKLNYTRNKGLDFVARFNGKYIIGEAKFLTDFGGHQNAQFEDAVSTIETPNVNAVKIAILDGVLYINSTNKIHTQLLKISEKHDIMSALLLREYLYSI